MKMKSFITTSRGRVTVLGDHQDYLGLKVIASPINVGLVFKWEVRSSSSPKVVIDSAPLGKIGEIRPHESLKGDEFDLARACLLVLEQRGIKFSSEIKVTVTGDLRPKSGLSSSAAFSIGFLKGLLKIANVEGVNSIDGTQLIPELAFKAEHDILGVPCGKLDQYTCHSNQPLLLEFSTPLRIVPLPFKFPLMVIDSLIPKSTEAVHVKVQQVLSSALEKITGRKHPAIIRTISSSEVIKNQDLLSPLELKTTLGVVKIRDCLNRMAAILPSHAASTPVMPARIFQKMGEEMFKEHHVLSDYLNVGHPVLDEIVELAKSGGALGAKLTGAGKGGAVVALLDPKDREQGQRLAKMMEDHGFLVVDVMTQSKY